MALRWARTLTAMLVFARNWGLSCDMLSLVSTIIPLWLDGRDRANAVFDIPLCWLAQSTKHQDS
jgi:hypothetical protein